MTQFFLVPYFGACLHMPPPPPNQIIFAQLEQGFDELDITKAYLLKGVLRIVFIDCGENRSGIIKKIAFVGIQFFSEKMVVGQWPHASGAGPGNHELVHIGEFLFEVLNDLFNLENVKSES